VEEGLAKAVGEEVKKENKKGIEGEVRVERGKSEGEESGKRKRK